MEPILFVDGAAGIYVPQRFAADIKRELVSDVAKEDLDLLADGPDTNEHYWEVWADVLDNATVTDPETKTKYFLWQDQDLWLIPEHMEWSDEDQFFVWPSFNEAVG